jgi:hypothetical protein
MAEKQALSTKEKEDILYENALDEALRVFKEQKVHGDLSKMAVQVITNRTKMAAVNAHNKALCFSMAKVVNNEEELKEYIKITAPELKIVKSISAGKTR